MHVDYTNTTGICLRAGHFDPTSKLNSLLYLASLSSDHLSHCSSPSQSSFPGPLHWPRSAEQTWKKVYRNGTCLIFYQLNYFLTLYFHIYYLNDTACLSLIYQLSPQWIYQYINSCPWNISLQDLSIQLLQATYPAAFFFLTLIWGNWLVRGVWNHTKQYYFSFPGLIRTGKGPTQTLGSIPYKWNTGQKK